MEKGQVVGYTGVPKNPHKRKEGSKWEKFVKWLLPWVGEKAAMAEKLIEAEVRTKVALAAKTEAEAEKIRAEAFKTKVEAVKIVEDVEKIKIETLRRKGIRTDNNVVDIPSEIIEEVRSELAEKLRRLSDVYGGQLLGATNAEPVEDEAGDTAGSATQSE